MEKIAIAITSVVLVLLLGLVLPIPKIAFASTHPGDETSTIGGWNSAAVDANADFYNSDGYSHGYDPTCPNGHDEQWCLEYKAGYNHEWITIAGSLPSTQANAASASESNSASASTSSSTNTLSASELGAHQADFDNAGHKTYDSTAPPGHDSQWVKDYQTGYSDEWASLILNHLDQSPSAAAAADANAGSASESNSASTSSATSTNENTATNTNTNNININNVIPFVPQAQPPPVVIRQPPDTKILSPTINFGQSRPYTTIQPHNTYHPQPQHQFSFNYHKGDNGYGINSRDEGFNQGYKDAQRDHLKGNNHFDNDPVNNGAYHTIPYQQGYREGYAKSWYDQTPGADQTPETIK